METASLIPTSRWKASEYEEKGTIMKTDVFIKVFSDLCSQEERAQDIAQGFRMFRDFQKRFSRFENDSELSQFNASEGGEVSPELFSLLWECKRFFVSTNGVFDPSILPVLEKIGYGDSKKRVNGGTFALLVFDKETQSVTKPQHMSIDLGGIGKGYIVDKVADTLSKKYQSGIVDAGGDMRLWGGDKEQVLDYFAIDVEDAFQLEKSATTLLLSDCAVATSGTNRRKWEFAGKDYHHIIDPATATSADSGIAQVTVIAGRAAEADVYAKTLLILGLERGLRFAQEKKIPALFITNTGERKSNDLFQAYEWKN